jgi:hypothetical protein
MFAIPGQGILHAKLSVVSKFSDFVARCVMHSKIAHIFPMASPRFLRLPTAEDGWRQKTGASP